jgi:Uma2 family endonuclease
MAQETAHESMAQRQLRRLDDAGLLADGGLRAELVGGELLIRGAPRPRHQEVVTRLATRLFTWAETHGGYAAVGPIGVELDPENSVRPDVIFVRADRAHLIREEGLYAGPDLVVEVASPGTTSLDLVEKRDIYQRLGVPEYWVVDLAREQVLVHRLGGGGYAQPQVLEGEAVLEAEATPGLRVRLAALLGRSAG